MSLILDGTSGLSDVDGTAAAPAIRGTDTNTGIFFPAADTIAFSEGSVEAMRIDASGNVGIGTSSPAKTLHVSSSSFDYVARVQSVGRTTTGIELVNSGSGANPPAIGSKSDAIFFETNNAERARIDSSGNLLVGATSGNGRVYVKGASATSSDHSIFCANSSASTSFSVRNDGYINTGLLAVSPYNYSVTGRNAYLDSAGGFGYLASVRAAKTNIENLNDISWIYNLNPVSFNYRKKDGENLFTDEFESEKHYGLIAEEVESVNQELCFYDNDGTLRGVSYDKLTSVLIKAIQEQQTLITVLTARITALEAQIV